MLQIRSNILGDLRNIRKGVVYKDATTVIDELVQNAQRAGADTVWIDIGSRLKVRDNGPGAADPQVIFEKNSSAWGLDEAFGEGFFSVFYLADELEVVSQDWRIWLDVEKMIESGNTELHPEPERTFRGFSVELSGPRVVKHEKDLLRRAQRLGESVPLKVIVNGQEIKKVPLDRRVWIEDEERRWGMHVENDVFYGYLAPGPSFAMLKTFYDGRPVEDMMRAGLTGALEIKPGKVTLRAPDRKDFVEDGAYMRFKELLEVEAKPIFQEIVRSGDERMIQKYADGIGKYVPPEEYVELLTVDGYDAVKALVEQSGKAGPKLVSLFRDEIPVWNGPENETPVRDGPEQAEDLIIPEPSAPRTPRITPPKTEEVPETKGIRLAAFVRQVGAGRIFFVHPWELESKDGDIQDARYKGFVVLVARNNLLERAFDFLGIQHIDRMKLKVYEDYETKNVGPRTKKETRLCKIMDAIGKEFGIPEGKITLADITGRILAEGTEDRVIQVHGLCRLYEGKVFLDRHGIPFAKYRPAPGAKYIGINDLKVLATVQDTLAHELAHLLFRTVDNTQAHFAATAMLSREIGNILVSKELDLT